LEADVLKKLLRRVAGQGTESSATLARELGIRPEIVRPMLDELTRLGYIHAVVPGCSKPCEGCPFHSMCLYHRQPRIWLLTEKGEAYLSKQDRTDR
jgi:predicted ArsR family transcriptional regulator